MEKVYTNCKLVLTEKTFVNDKGEKIDYIESKLTFNGVETKINFNKSDKALVRYMFKNEK